MIPLVYGKENVILLDRTENIVEEMRKEIPLRNQTTTLTLGDTVPGFTLAAANREGTFTLAELLRHGPVILEFLRGTW